MKTTLEGRLAAASANMKLAAHKTFKHPITSILSLCLVASIAATIASFSQKSEPTATVAPKAQTMPVARTLTSADGRTIDVTILSKSDTAIKAKKADDKEFEITLDKLSDADKAFVAKLKNPPVKKPKVLLINNYGPQSSAIRKADMEYDMTIFEGHSDQYYINLNISLNDMTDQDLKKYDLIWVCWSNEPISDSFLDLLKRYKGVIALVAYNKTTTKDFFNKKDRGVAITKAYVRSENNIIFYSSFELINKIRTENYTYMDAVINEFLKLRVKYHH